MYFGNIILINMEKNTLFPAVVGLVSILASMVLGIILAFKLGETVKQKLLMIFFMPTNYTWLILIIAFIKFVNSVFDSMIGLSSNFG